SATLLGGDRQFADPLGEDLASLGILALFAVLDVRPLGMTSHNDSDFLESQTAPPLYGAGRKNPAPKRKGASMWMRPGTAYSTLVCSRSRMCSSRRALASTMPGAWVMTHAALWV